MSKKKNTLNDLEEFLKMQASALVTPAPLGDAPRETAPAPPREKQPAKPVIEERTSLNESELLAGLQRLSLTDKKAFYDLVIRATENLANRSQEDNLLINTALYLKGGIHWKDTVRNYWKGN
jgi:hypothetical protein